MGGLFPKSKKTKGTGIIVTSTARKGTRKEKKIIMPLDKRRIERRRRNAGGVVVTIQRWGLMRVQSHHCHWRTK